MHLCCSPSQLTDVDDDDWDISSIEEEFFLTKDGRGQKASAVQKNESNAASVVQTRGLPKRSAPKEEGNVSILVHCKPKATDTPRGDLQYSAWHVVMQYMVFCKKRTSKKNCVLGFMSYRYHL